MEVLSLFKSQSEPRSKITYLNISKIKPNPYQPRKHFDTPALEELSNSIRQYGVIQPISVRRIGTSYELIAGERRLKAAEMADLFEVPCIICDYSDNDSAIIALLENLQRQDLTFFEEAEAYESLIKKHGLTQERLAERLGKNQSTIANKIRLLKLPPFVKKILIDHQLTERHARALLKLPDEELQMNAVEEIVNRGFNVQETEAFIQQIIDKYSKEAKKKASSSGKKNVRMYKDIRIFINTIKEAVETMVKSGIEAKSEKTESDDYIEYIIKIPKGA